MGALQEQLSNSHCLSENKNKMLKVLLIDDEKNALSALRKLLEQFCPDVQVVGEAQTALEGLRLIRQQSPDIVFLDVEMPGGTGFDLLEALDKINFSTIFTTAHEQYTIPAIRAGASDYLLKPVSVDELRAAIQRVAIKGKAGYGTSEDLRVSVSNHKGTWFVPVTDIVYIEAEGRYSRFFLMGGEEYPVSKNLGELQSELSPMKFFRVHKSWLVNCRHVTRISSSDGGFAIMSNGKEIEISRRRRAEFMRMMEPG
jgi:two-component system, LytTR family, response regulator